MGKGLLDVFDEAVAEIEEMAEGTEKPARGAERKEERKADFFAKKREERAARKAPAEKDEDGE